MYFMLELFSAHDADERLGNDAGIKSQRPALQIVSIHMQTDQHLFHSIGIAIIEGGFRRQSGPHLIDEHIAGVVGHNLVDIKPALRTGAYKRHVALQHIPELGQFVEMMLTQEQLSLCGLPYAAFRHKLRLLLWLAHGAELVNGKRLPSISDALLRKYSRTVFLSLQHDGYHQIDRREDYHAGKREDYVKQALDGSLNTAHRVMAAFETAHHFCILITHFVYLLISYFL